MKIHNNHETENPLQALHEIVRNQFTPEVKRLLNQIEKETNPFAVKQLIDEIHVVCDKAWHSVQKRFLGECVE